MPRGKKAKVAGGKAKNRKQAVNSAASASALRPGNDPSIFRSGQQRKLESLPNEVLLSILNAFGVDIKNKKMLQESIKVRTALSKLALVSKQFNEIATPALYSTQIQTGKNALPQFVKQMLDKPERQKYVKKIIARGYDAMDLLNSRQYLTDYNYENEELNPTNITFDSSKLCNMIQARNLAYDDRALDWTDQAMDGEWESLFALLLCLMSDLEELVLADLDLRNGLFSYLYRPFAYSKDPSRFQDEWLQNQTMPPAPLTKLKHISLDSTTEVLQIDFVSSFLHHASLQSFTIDSLAVFELRHGVTIDKKNVSAISFPLPAIKRLKMGGLYIQDEVMLGFLGRSTSLETLQIYQVEDLQQNLDIKAFKMALQPMQNTLKRLDIMDLFEKSHVEVERSEEEWERLCIGSLQAFVNLEKLMIDG